MFGRTGRSLTRHPGAVAAVAAILAVVVQFSPSGAASSIGPVPATTNAVTLTTSATDGLTDGSAVTFTVNTSGSTKLISNLTAHLCIDGPTSYNGATFGYSGSSATECVYSPGIVSGGLTGSDYEDIYGPYAGTESTSGSLTFHVGTGTVEWGNVTGNGPFFLTADATHTVDLVLQVNLSGDATTQTYFIQPLTFAGTGTTTTTTVPVTTTTTIPATTTTTIPGTTTTTIPGTTTTTTVPVTTTTTVPVTTTTTVPVTTTTTTVPVTTTTVPVTTTTTGSVTTTTAPGSTTTVAPTTSTTFSSTGSTDTTAPTTSPTTSPTVVSSSTGSGSTGSGGGSLPFTGGDARNLVSIALLMLAAGMLLLGQYHRRRNPGHEG